ncbi:MAG: polysaccharide deacetylase family protein [Proteobacteria bacterium]|nr:polysaccharide deacetylase family protein [Pseudomonadota bacterium]
MTGWDDLARELDAWATAGRVASFWWRDDDATAATPKLDRLLALRRQHGVPLGLAVIPARAEAALAQCLAGEPDVIVLQHGWAHANHAPPGQAKAELGPHRPLSLMLGELARGGLALDRLFAGGWLRALVPPNNRIAPLLAEALPQAGYIGLSTYNERRRAPSGLIQVNAHIDIMDWVVTRAFAGEKACLARAADHLKARREDRADAEEPTGLLTHHLAHDAAAWDFADALLGFLRRHRAARFLSPATLFGAA